MKRLIPCLVSLAIAVPLLGQELVCAPVDNTSLPVSPWTCAPFNGPFTRPAVFFAPHPDDETLGMAGAISQAVAEGRTVIIELMTRGTKSSNRTALQNDGGSHSIFCDSTFLETLSHPACNVALTEDQLGDARVREMMDSARRLGVAAIAIHDNIDGQLSASAVTARAQWWIQRGDGGLSLYGTAGTEDYNVHPDHQAVSQGLLATGYPDITRQMVYAFRQCNVAARQANSAWRRVPLASSDHANKRNALLAYQVFNLTNGRYAFGWMHSTGDLFEGGYADASEYVTLDSPVHGGPSTGNPFVYTTINDQKQSCYGISLQTSSYCGSVADPNDQRVCNALALHSQTPCTQVTDRNLQLACYGMAFAPNYPSNCRDITDLELQKFCYGVSGADYTKCIPLANRNTQLLCYAMSNGISSNCRDISDRDLKEFCYGASSHNSSYCAIIGTGAGASCDPFAESSCASSHRSWNPYSCTCS